MSHPSGSLIAQFCPVPCPPLTTPHVPSQLRSQTSVAELKLALRIKCLHNPSPYQIFDPQPQQMCQPLLHSPGTCFPTISATLSSDSVPSSDAEGDYSIGLSQYCSSRNGETHAKASVFRHKYNKKSLWVDCWHNKTSPKKNESENIGLHCDNWGGASRGHSKHDKVYSKFEDHVLAEQLVRPSHACKAASRSAVQVKPFKMQLLREGSDWGMPDLEQTLIILDRNAELPSVENFICILQKCRRGKKLAYAKRLHAHICNNGLEAHRYLGNYIVPMYVECGSVLDAQQVFNKLVHRNEHSWTSLISGYIQCGQCQHAFNVYKEMQEDGVCPSNYTLVALLKACARLKDVERGRETHAQITQKGFDRDLFAGITLIDMYAKCGSLSEAQEVFDKLPVRDVVAWTALIAGYAEHGPVLEALKCFEQMQLEGISPNALTFVCTLKACGSIRAIDKGREIHGIIAQKGIERELFVGSSLVDMYAKCGYLSEARGVFDMLLFRDVVSWNALIAGYAEYGPGQEALACFDQMQLEGICPSAVTFASILKACGSIGAMDKAREIHRKVTEKGFDNDLIIGNTLVDMYAKCGLLLEAQEVFDKVPVRDVVTWTSLIAAYAEHGSAQEAMKYFEQMQLEGVSPNAVTFACGLKACGRLGAIDKGREMHAEIAQKGFEQDLFVGNTLIDMYAKCGSLLEAREVFDKLPVRDVVSWDAMINGYGMNHEGNLAIQCFEDMREQGVKPGAVTFTCLLTACSRASLVVEGQQYFQIMKEEYDIEPTIGHYTCMVDLLARSGHLHEAENFLENIPCSPSIEMWTALLTACKTYGEVELGLRCFQQLVRLNPAYASAYVLMANIYANAGRKDDAYRIEELRIHAGATKKPASALIEVNKKMHEFVVGNNQSKEISAVLESLNSRMKEEGHAPNLDLVLRPISDEEKEDALCEHAEKLALAFGLLNTEQGQTLRVTKNMRMCVNCHNANKIISRIEKREIIVRDGYCVHHFKNSVCSCGDVF